ncbi:MAG: CoA transferase subunit A [Armatimonadota bacterium]|nr:CoA transferase subunit A [Armatimonadota bacterium]
MQKVVASCQEAIADIPDGATIMFGGWGPAGDPENLIRALLEKGTKDITAIANDPGNDRDGIVYGIHLLIKEKRVKKFIGSYHAWNQEFIRQYQAGELEFEVCSQGILAERIRAGGAGIFGFYTDVGADTLLAEGKEKKVLDGRECVLELPLKADFALLKAFKADKWGNLQYRFTAQNFNPVMATAARVVIAEAEHIVGVGDLGPNEIHTPGIYVDRIVRGDYYAPRF